MKSPFVSMRFLWSRWMACGCVVFFGGAGTLCAGFVAGDLVRLRRNETLLFRGESFLPAPKGQEFTVFKQEPGKDAVYVAFIQKDGAVIAVTLPESALELVEPDGWIRLQRGMDAFRENRFEETRRWLALAGKEADYRALAGSLLLRVEGAMAAAAPALGVVKAGGFTATASAEQKARLQAAQRSFGEALGKLRETPVDLDRLGFASLALGFDDGLDRLSRVIFGEKGLGEGVSEGGVPVTSKLDRAEVLGRVNRAGFSLVRCRQAMGVKRMMEASTYAKEGLAAEPGHPGLKALMGKVEEHLKDAEERYQVAASNRRGKNLSQGLLALERGLKLCADHPQLLELKKELAVVLEQGASPVVTAEMVAASKGQPKERLEEGRKLYVNRCAECHDLEMLDSRSMEGWKSEVEKMSGKAHLKGDQKALILAYLAAAKGASGGESAP